VKRLLVLMLMMMLLVGERPPSVGQERPPRVDWLEDYSLALEEAVLTRRPILLTFTATWCGWCRKLEGTTFRHPSFAEVARQFVPVRVDGDREKGLRGLFRVTGYPTTVVLSRAGREITRIRGYRPPDAFVRTLRLSLDRREPVEAVRREAERRPGDPQAQYALGDVLLAMGDYEGAREAFEAVLSLGEAGTGDLADDALLDMALTYLYNYDFVGSIPVLEEYLTRFPRSERRDQGLFFHGVALVRVGRVEEGLRQVESASAITSLDYIKFEGERLRSTIREDGDGLDGDPPRSRPPRDGGRGRE
jgi:thioredoxin-related protein